MARNKRLKTVICLLAVATTALLAAAAPGLPARVSHLSHALPPGVKSAPRQLITVWFTGSLPGAGSWLKARAADYSRRREGVSVWLRTVTRQDLDALDAAPPDVVVFTAETPLDPGLLQPCALPEGLGPRRAARGQYDGQQLALPLCLSGYVLAEPVPAPAAAQPSRSLFGLRPTPDPGVTPAPLLPDPWPQRLAADDRFGVLALSAMDAPSGASLLPAEALQGRFLAGETAALLSLRQARAAAARGMGLRAAGAAPATDLVLYGALTARAGAGAADFLADLLTAESQSALASEGLLPARDGLRLYGEDQPLARALEGALAQGWLAPAFTWARDMHDRILTAQALYEAGQSAKGLLE